MKSTGFSKPDPLVTMTALEFRVWQMKDRGIGHMVATIGKSEAVISSAFSRAYEKSNEQQARAAIAKATD